MRPMSSIGIVIHYYDPVVVLLQISWVSTRVVTLFAIKMNTSKSETAADAFNDISDNNFTSTYFVLFYVFLIYFSAKWLYSTLSPHGNAAFSAPIVGSKWAFIGRLRYLTNATELLQEGFQKVCYRLPVCSILIVDTNLQYKTTFFKINGNDMLVVPNKYVNELRAIPEERLSSMVANIDVSFSQNFETCTKLLILSP